MAFRTVDVAGTLGHSNGLEIRFPDTEHVSQDREWVAVQIGGAWKKIRLHDYDQLYNIPGLYETIFQRTLETSSPVRVVSLLQDVMSEYEDTSKDLRVLDVGAGNGMVAYELQNIGVQRVVGIDIIEEARTAALRDRSWCYDDYYVGDLTDLPERIEAELIEQRLNAMTCVAALGFNDIPAEAFLKSVDLLETPAWLAFNIKEDFVQERDTSGFANLLKELARQDVIQMLAYRRYQHRLSATGQPLHYIAMIARKIGEVPDSLRA